MKKREKILLISASAITLFLIFRPMVSTLIINVFKGFFPSWEGFSSVPYWDYKQWSWGYGTRVPGSVNDKSIRPTGTISREQAMIDALKHVEADYSYLKPLVKVALNPNQWAAYLSFAYNLGTGNADNLIANINAQNWTALETQWKKYVYAGGVVNDDLVARRNAEWKLFIS